jgi:hypothetical protein
MTILHGDKLGMLKRYFQSNQNSSWARRLSTHVVHCWSIDGDVRHFLNLNQD